MIYSSKESLEDVLIRILSQGPKKVIEIQEVLKQEEQKISFQGVYKILNGLIRGEVIIKRGPIYSVNEEWRRRVITNLDNSNPLIINEKEKVSFELSSLVHLDKCWKNLVLPLHQAYPEDPIFIYNRHEVWMHLDEHRKQSELDYYHSFEKNKTQAFYVIGGNTMHDQTIKQKLQNNNLQIVTGAEYFSQTDYPIIFNDYIITTRISKSIAIKIEDCYQETRDLETLEKRLQRIGIEKSRCRLIILKDRVKAKQLRKMMSKKFFVPPVLAKKFELF